MGTERERKFLLASDRWRHDVIKRVDIVQGYLCADENLEVRVRTANGVGSITVKGKRIGDDRPEYKARTEPGDAEAMLANDCRWSLIKKVRHEVPQDGLMWEIDVFLEGNEGLVLAEIELPESRAWPTSWPDWVGDEVTRDKRYYNQYLSQRPFQTW